MGKRKRETPRSTIRAALRRLWLRSRERAEALRRTGYCCQNCGIKQSRAKGKEISLEVHHVNHVSANIEQAIDAVYACLIHPADQLMPLCKDCHNKIHSDFRK